MLGVEIGPAAGVLHGSGGGPGVRLGFVESLYERDGRRFATLEAVTGVAISRVGEGLAAEADGRWRRFATGAPRLTGQGDHAKHGGGGGNGRRVGLAPSTASRTLSPVATRQGRRVLTDDFERKTAEAAAALENLRDPAERAAGAIEAAFGRAGDGLARSLARAAADGEVSLGELAKVVLAAVNAAAGTKGSGLGEAVAAAVGGLFGGARAEGGPVTGGGAYLVGERGPEVFRPAGAGTVESVGGGAGLIVNVTVDGGAPALLRSEAQIAQMLARAAALGARRL